jgi:hypothetical protein
MPGVGPATPQIDHLPAVDEARERRARLLTGGEEIPKDLGDGREGRVGRSIYRYVTHPSSLRAP